MPNYSGFRKRNPSILSACLSDKLSRGNCLPSSAETVEKGEVRSKETVSADPHLIFQSAEAFFNALRTLDTAAKRGNPFIFPLTMAVNSALALELYLKCLRTIEAGNFLKGHEFDEQYFDLEKSTKNEIQRRHDEIETNSQFFADIRARGFKTDLASLLKMGRKTFVHFRYAFENNPSAQDTIWALDDFMLIVRDIVLERHPEWTPKGYPPPRQTSPSASPRLPS